jgi:flagellar basal-body rod protein FlgC
LKYEPNHPDANTEGYVAYPNINTMEEMANMIEASRAYEANINAMATAKGMAMKDLEIGR